LEISNIEISELENLETSLPESSRMELSFMSFASKFLSENKAYFDVLEDLRRELKFGRLGPLE
jgi:hypothetical protein